jgi:sulfur-oxidizing protein SoxA
VVGVLIVMAVSAFAGEIPRAERRSGYELMSPETRAMQDDDTANPGMLWVLEGEALWNRKIGACRVDRQQAPPLAHESRELLALTAYVARQSRGLPIDVTIDARTQPFLDAGRATFHRRQGQLNLACSQCHDDHWGRQLAGNVIPQAHPTGYPIYRLEWQAVGSLVDLELYLMSRAAGMKMDAPAVRP